MNTKVLASLSVIVALVAGLLVITVLKSTKVSIKSVAQADSSFIEPVRSFAPVGAETPTIVSTQLDTRTQKVNTSLKVTK